MIFEPMGIIKNEGSFCFGSQVCAKGSACLNKDIIKEFWNGFCSRSSVLTIEQHAELTFRIGNVDAIISDESDYTVNVTADGVCVWAQSEKELIRGLMTLLDRIKAVDTDDGIGFVIDCCEIRDRARIKNRMVHFCMFNTTELWELDRFLRLCGALKYTHVIVEFWGCLKLDCMPELSWPNGYTKEEIAPIFEMARDLGLELIPMINHWGHAPEGRSRHGKHVVLDQNPALSTYFTEDGWCWDIKKQKVRDRLRHIRQELCELFGEGEYFHIGCDEAYNFDFSDENMDLICGFINEVNAELMAEGRRAIIWGDMFLSKRATYNAENRYTCNSKSEYTEKYMMNALDKRVMIGDWQYEPKTAPVETALTFKEYGFECMICTFDKGFTHVKACADTVTDNALFGLMHTTWHTLSMHTPQVTVVAVNAYEDIEPSHRSFGTQTAALMRKIYFVNGDYRKAGWAKFEIGVITE